MQADAEVDPEKARRLEEVAERLRGAKLDMAIRAADWIRQGGKIVDDGTRVGLAELEDETVREIDH